EPTGDEKFFSLSRQPKCIPIVATQSFSSLKSTLPGETWRTLVQTFRTKVFLTLSDDFSAKAASGLCGREERLKAGYNFSESGHDAHISLLTGKAVSLGEKALLVAVKNIARRLGGDISESHPILDSRLPDGSRVAAVIPPSSLNGVTLTIRKFNTRHFEIEDLIARGTLDQALANR